MILVNDLKLMDIAANSTLNDRTTCWIYESIDYTLQKKHNEIMKKFWLDLESLTDKELDYMMWEFHVDYIEDGISRENKIELIKTSIISHFNKGTIGSVKTICKILFGDAEITEWFDYGGQPGYFKIKTLSELNSTMDYTKVFDVVNEYKNVRSWLDKLAFKRNFDFKKYIGIFSERKLINTLNMRSFELPWYEQTLNEDIISVVVKENNIGSR